MKGQIRRFIAPRIVSMPWCIVLSRGAPFYRVVRDDCRVVRRDDCTVRRFIAWCAVLLLGAL